MNKLFLLLLWLARGVLVLLFLMTLCGVIAGTTEILWFILSAAALVIVEGVLRVNGVNLR